MSRLFRYTLELLLNNFHLLAIPILVGMILKGFFFPPGERTQSHDTILITGDSLKTSSGYANTRLQILLNSIHQHQGTELQIAIASESLKMQGRLLFITLFAGLITVLYSIKEKRPRQLTALTALVVGLFWYAISVHKLDIENRTLPADDMINNTEIALLNISPDDCQLYHLDFIKLQKVLEQGKKCHLKRKILRFITPDISDMVFNLAPLLILVIIYRLRKHTNGAA